jgi:putative nucleotidyltransferase with HDIG domain
MRFANLTTRLDSATRRSVTLLRAFLAASAVILLAGGLILSWILTTALREQAIAGQRASLTAYVDGVLRPAVVRDGHVVVQHFNSRQLLESIERQRDIVSVKVWMPDGTLAWANRGRNRIGKRFDLEGHLGEVINENRAIAEFGELHGGSENEVERSLGIRHLFEVYAPLRDTAGNRALGAYEIYADATALNSFIASRQKTVWLAVAGVFLVLYAALALLVRGASRTLRRQTVTLRERSRELLVSYRLLEQSSFDAIETLNATVEAKDPYTAGHSARVQRVAVALGERLVLSPAQLDTLRYGGLFHDIGKIGVPDAILLKPARLTPDEYQVMKRHSEDGAQIVGKLARLRETVPLIRHHHEHWNGRGYPDGLAGEQIPLDASIVGLADAWDAMTTERPYARALTLAEALAQIREGRGTQFAPVVVDAFLGLVVERPEAIGALAEVSAQAV